MATKTSRKYWDFKLLSKNPHTETVDLYDNNIQYNQLFLTRVTDTISLKLLRKFEPLKEEHAKNIKSPMICKEIRKTITNRSRLFKKLRKLWQIM